jgi:hypothetical protein
MYESCGLPVKILDEEIFNAVISEFTYIYRVGHKDLPHFEEV